MQAELLVLNGIIFSALAVGLAIRLRRRPPGPEELAGVYGRLAFTLTKKFSDLPAGFTLREGLARARASTPSVDWVSLENELSSYEAFKFGGGNLPTGPKGETLKLLKILGGI